MVLWVAAKSPRSGLIIRIARTRKGGIFAATQSSCFGEKGSAVPSVEINDSLIPRVACSRNRSGVLSMWSSAFQNTIRSFVARAARAATVTRKSVADALKGRSVLFLCSSEEASPAAAVESCNGGPRQPRPRFTRTACAFPQNKEFSSRT